MQIFDDDEDEESLPKKAYEEGCDGPQPKKPLLNGETEEAFENYINTLGDNEKEITEHDLTPKERKIVNDA